MMKVSSYQIPAEARNDEQYLMALYDEACNFTCWYNDEYNRAFDISDRKVREKAKKVAHVKQKQWLEIRETLWGRIQEVRLGID